MVFAVPEGQGFIMRAYRTRTMPGLPFKRNESALQSLKSDFAFNR